RPISRSASFPRPKAPPRCSAITTPTVGGTVTPSRCYRSMAQSRRRMRDHESPEPGTATASLPDAKIMLAALSIRDIVLIDRLDLEFRPGLCVLTGETGAGKSILLDAFTLAIGGRGDAPLVGQRPSPSPAVPTVSLC